MATQQNPPAAQLQQIHYQPYLSLGMIAITVKGYSGKSSPKQYFKEIEERAELDGWTADIKLKIVRYRLEGDARNFYDTELASDNTLTWATFKDKLTNKFAPKKLPGESALHLAKCYQRMNEPVAQYITRLKILAKDMLEEDLRTATEQQKEGIKKKNSDILLNQFQMGIRQDLKKQILPKLVAEQTLTIDKAEQIALQHEV